MIRWIGRMDRVNYWMCQTCNTKFAMDEPVRCKRCDPAMIPIGDWVAKILHRVGIRKKQCSPCNRRKEQLNRWGDAIYHGAKQLSRTVHSLVGEQ